MRVKGWLYDLAYNHYVDLDKDGEVVILPIEEDDTD